MRNPSLERKAALKAMFQVHGTRPALTAIEELVYEFLYGYLADNSFQPSVRDIGRQFGFTNTAAVVAVLNSLHEKGYVVRDTANARALVLQ